MFAVGFLLVSGVSFGDAGNVAADRVAGAAASPAAVSVQPSGSGDGFYYQQLPSDPNVYSVTFSDNGGVVLVSDSFLSLVLHFNGVSADTKLKMLQSYPAMVATNFDTIVNSTFPDQTQAPVDTLDSFECTDASGTHVTVAQDALASPYVRVTVRDKSGTTESFSINRKFVEGLLRQEDMEGDRLAFSITSFPFRLPENTRLGFANLTREQMNEIVLHVPAFQRQEIIRMPRFFREKAPEIMAKLSNAPPRAAAPPSASNTPAAAVALAQPKPSVQPSAVHKSAPGIKPDGAPVNPPQNKRYSDWLAISGWVAAAAAVLWAVTRRRR